MKQVTAASPAADLLAYYGGPASDVYFQRAHTTLSGAHVDAVVAMDFFSSKAGILCGVTEAVRLLSGVLQEGDQAWADRRGRRDGQKGNRAPSAGALLAIRRLRDGAARHAVQLLRLGDRRARDRRRRPSGKRVISFGARHVHPLIGPTMEYSAVVGGCAGCATPLGAQLAGLQGASGTMPHAMILVFGDTVKAALAFDEHMPDDVLRIVLVDTFKDEA